jgi:hypothetical protein
VDWIYLAQGRGQWRAFMNTVMNLWGISWLAGWLAASEEGFRSKESVTPYIMFQDMVS